MTRLNSIAFILICSTGILTTLAYGTVHQPVIAIFYLLICLQFLIFAADSLFGGILEFSRSRLQIPLILLGLYGVFQSIPFGTISSSGDIPAIPRTISIEPFATRVVALHIFALSSFFLLCLSTISSAKRLRRIVGLITIFGAVYAFFAILQSVLSPEKIYGIYKPSAGVPFGSFVNRHNFAAIMEMTIAVPMGLLFVGALRSDKKLLYVVAISTMGAALLLSGSRGGLVAFLVEIVVLIVLTRKGATAKGRSALSLKIALSFLLIFAAVGGAIFVGGDTSLTRISETVSSDDITSSRAQIWNTTTKVIEHGLPFGVGLGAFPQAYTMFDPAGGYERVEQAHNDYLQIVADAGIIGTLLGAVFMFWFFREGIKNASVVDSFRRGSAIGAFAGCTAILVHSLFDFVLHITAVSIVFLTLLSILVASGRNYDDDVDEYDEPKRRSRRANVTPIRE